MFLINQIIDRQKTSKFICFSLMISLNLNLTSCNFLNSANPFNSKSPIKIEAIAERKRSKPIYIAGTVIKIAPLLRNNAYQVQDNTGKIWVITTEKLPSIGQNILIKCQIQSQNLSLDNQDLDKLYLVELEQLASP